ncbi:alpha-rhamnosidase [Bacteroidia bacterium]|nr:alpha-rhamnosidase [Bacteroidia bacterium]
MKHRLTFFYLLTSTALVAQNPVGLRCEHLANPLGVDVEAPRLSWRLDDARYGAVQKAYRVVVGTDSLAVAQGRGGVWDSQKQAFDRMLVACGGANLQPFSKYYWRVSTWDNDDVEHSSAVASFETGVRGNHWQGAWISDGHGIDFKPAPYFRKAFPVEKEIKSARAYIAVAGLYELYLNGEKVGDHRLDPMYTRFDRRTLYVTYDVTAHLRQGRNAVGVLLGNGWYNHQSIGVWDFDRAPWRNRPAFCLDLRITYADGSVATIASERDWKTATGALVFNSIYTAEHYDARLESQGWNTAEFDDSKWRGVRYRAAPSDNIVSQQLHPIRNVEEIAAQSVKKINDTTCLFDLGRNIAGVTKIRVKGDAGTTLRVKHTERLDAHGRADMSNIDVYHRPKDDTDPFQTDIYTLAGTGTEEFMPKFNYKGFRYVEVTTDKPVQLTKESLTGYFMHSDVPPVGELDTSNPLINKLWRATNASYLSNLYGIPTDCPQREKNGWTGDGHLGIETGLFNFEAITIYEKWLADHRDEQQPNGVLPDIIPTGGWGYGTDNGVDWTSTIAIIPWNIYLFYGDSKLLSDCYENIKRYVDYITRNSPDGLTSWARGDWVPVKSRSSLELTSSIYYYTDALILSKAAQLFGRQQDYAQYTALAEKIKTAVNDKYLNREAGIYANGTQTELSVPLLWGIVPEDCKAKVAQNLAQAVEKDGFHIDVGVLGAKAVLNALSENGYADVACKLAAQDTYPGWGWWIANGATTLLENWDLKATRDISDNHMMFGEIGGWFFKALGGIKPDEARPGFKNIKLAPHFAAGLTHATVSYRSPYGEIRSQWARKKTAVAYTVAIPANATADFTPPAGYTLKSAKASSGEKIALQGADAVYHLPAGKYLFELKIKN